MPEVEESNALHEALKKGHTEEASKLIASSSEEFLLERYATNSDYRDSIHPSHKSCLHIIAAMSQEPQAVKLCRELLDRVRDHRKRDCLLNATVMDEFKENEQTLLVVVAAIHIAAYNGNAD